MSFIGPKTTVPICQLKRAIFLSKAGLKTLQQGKPSYVIPKYSFLEKPFTLLNLFTEDNIYARFNENSKVISIEGNVGIGKAHLAKELAARFDMKFIPDVDEDLLWQQDEHAITVDLRDYNTMLTEGAQYYTMEKFWNDPNPIKKGRPLALQFYIMAFRYWQYSVGLCHLFQTGQGIITDRSPNSDYVFPHALRDCGLMSNEAYEIYTNLRRNSVPAVLKPHVIVYYKTSINFVLEKIKQRNVPWEQGACNLNEKFFRAYQDIMENDYLQKMSKYSEILTVDADSIDVTDPHDIDYIADELSRFNLEWDQYIDHDKFLQWKIATQDKYALNASRYKYTCAKSAYLSIFKNLNRVFHPEMSRNPSEREEVRYILSKDPRQLYDGHFHPKYRDLSRILLGLPTGKKKNFASYELPRRFMPL